MVHVSYYLKRKYETPVKGIPHKRAKLLDALLDAIPMQQLQRAFAMKSRGKLNLLTAKYPQFKKVNDVIFEQLQALFHEQY